jgi:hypothetical protein
MARGQSSTQKETTEMRRVKLAVFPIAIAAAHLIGPAAAQGYFSVR